MASFRVTSPKQPRQDSIEQSLEEKRSAASLALEREFREKYAKHNDVLAQNFELPRSEFVIDHYACAHYGKIPKQGKLYITPRLVVFFANILGKKVKKKIPFENIVEIKKDSSTLLSVSPIEILMKYKRFTFVSFSHREKAYAHLLLQWKSNREGTPFDVKIPLEDEDEGEGADEGESASLSHNQAEEPASAPKVEIQSMWGSQASSVESHSLSSQQPRGTSAPMPSVYSNGGTQRKKRMCSCLPCFK